MGTTCFYCPTVQQERAEIESLCTFTSEDGTKHFPLAISKVGSNYYAAVRKEGKVSDDYVSDENNGYVFGVVFKTSRHGSEFCHKTIEEGSGPYYFDAPAKILKLLSPTTNEYANNWRKECENLKNAKKAIKNLKEGDKVEVAEELSFGGIKEKVFTVTSYTRRGKNRRCFFSPKVGLCRLSPDNLKGFKLVEK